MRYLNILLCCFWLLPGCSISDSAEVWRVNGKGAESFGIMDGMTFVLQKDSVVFHDGRVSVSFGFVQGDERVILHTHLGKLIFSVSRSDDSLIIWRELYSDQPLEIMLSKINNN